jgi:hypothetical protein
MSDYKFLKPEEGEGFFEPKSFPNTCGVQDIIEKRLADYISMPNPSVIANSSGLKPISALDQVFEKNRNSFLKLKEALLSEKDYVNKFIAIIDGEIVDSDYDRSTLAERVYARCGYVQLFIGKVTKQKRYRHLPSPRRVRV